MFSKRYKALVHTADKFKTNLSVIKNVIKSNDKRNNLLLNKILKIKIIKLKIKLLHF